VEAPGVERRLAAILAADVVGYSRLMEADEAGTHARLKALRQELIEPAITRHKGRIVKLTGDGALVEFPSAVGAVLAAAETQRAAAEHEAGLPPEERIAFRIGINLGDVIIEEGDIYGDGVNVAARLEALAEPGGICVARTVYNQVKGKVDFGFAPAGEHRVKNISEPVSVYRAVLDGARWRPTRGLSAAWRRGAIAAAAAALAAVVAGGALWFQPWRSAERSVSAENAPLKLPSKPSIAVLPFANLNDNPEEELLIDGLTNDIITDLSKFSTLFVIAANSTFRYKGKAVDVKDVARDLGVRYVLEGSVQRSGDTLRINAQLIDATTGAHVWAERYDRPAKDFFAIQNEVTHNVVAVIYPLAEGRGKLQRVELERIEHTPTENLKAYDYFLRGMVYIDRFTKEDNLRAREMFEKALELDPGYARAMGKNVWTYLLEYWSGWSDNPNQLLEQAMQMAKRGIAADPNEPWAHWGLASALVMQKRFDEALREYEKAYDLNPNDANVVTELGWGLALMGRAEEGIPLMQQAMRLNPFHPDWYWVNLGEGYFMAGRYEESVAALEQISQPWSRIYQVLAASYAQAGRSEDARTALAKHLELEPQMTLEHAVASMPFNAEGQERYREALRKAGLPGKAPAPGT
jgi:adenylate cyclase